MNGKMSDYWKRIVLLKENLKAVEEDYRALMQIMERAENFSVPGGRKGESEGELPNG